MAGCSASSTGITICFVAICVLSLLAEVVKLAVLVQFEPERSMTVQRVLTGITTSGTPHLGNYAGAIRPAVAASRQPGVESFYFLADYHALIKTTDPLRVQRSTLEIAATWLAAGLDTDRVWMAPA